MDCHHDLLQLFNLLLQAATHRRRLGKTQRSGGATGGLVHQHWLHKLCEAPRFVAAHACCDGPTAPPTESDAIVGSADREVSSFVTPQYPL